MKKNVINLRDRKGDKVWESENVEKTHRQRQIEKEATAVLR